MEFEKINGIRKSYKRIEPIFPSYTYKHVKRGSERELVRVGKQGRILDILA